MKQFNFQGSADVLLSLFSRNETSLDSDKVEQPSCELDTPHLFADINALNEVGDAIV